MAKRKPTNKHRGRRRRPLPKVAHKRKASPKAGKRTPPSIPADQIRITLDAYRRSQDELSARGLEVLAVADHLGKAAVSEFRTRLHASLLDDRLLDDLAVLSMPMEQASRMLSEKPNPRMLASAVLQWIDQHLELRPHLHVGEELEIPARELEAFEVTGEKPDDLASLVKVRVVRPGWRYGRETLCLPRVELCSAATETPI